MREVIGTNKNRQALDFYTTDPKCVRDIMLKENICYKSILENSVGNGHIANKLKEWHNTVFGIDIMQRDYPVDLVQDFLATNLNMKFDLAVYNPPFKYLLEFINKTWQYTDRQILFVRLQFLESIKRYDQIFSKGYLEKVYVYSGRQITNANMSANSMCFCWFVLDKNNTDKPTIEWI